MTPDVCFDLVYFTLQIQALNTIVCVYRTGECTTAYS